MKHFLFSFIAAVFSLALFAQNVECPKAVGGDGGQILVKTGFTVSYNHRTGCPDWVAWRLTKEHLEHPVTSRGDEFHEDTQARKKVVYPRDYSNNGRHLDRGHMCPSADQVWSQEANDDSFLMTNICPQDHALNEGLWLELEQRCRTYAKIYGEVLVCCGPVWGKDVASIANGKILVPSAFFKVIASRDQSGKWHQLGFVFENEPLDKSDDIFGYAVDVQEIEQTTGLVFFPEIKNAIEDPAERFWNIRWKKR